MLVLNPETLNLGLGVGLRFSKCGISKHGLVDSAHAYGLVILRAGRQPGAPRS